jgi:hypothetical protein
MIKENEIRIGNWVIDNTREKSRYIKLDSNEVYELIGTGNWDYIEPIPLTPEILEKAGFEEDKLHECYVIKQFGCGVAIEFFDNEINLVGHKSAEDLPCKYVHQLQNLIYSLTGEELMIEL